MAKSTSIDRVEDILNAILLIRSFTKGINETIFIRDLKIQSAVKYQFLIIGEAVRHLDDELLNKYNYPWHIPRSFRNFIIHEYHEVKIERIYYAAKDLDTLEGQIKLILKDMLNA